VESDTLAVVEFQVWVRRASGEPYLLDWSQMQPYPLSFVRSLTRPEDIAHAWHVRLQLPAPLYDGQEMAIPVWLKESALVSELWPLCRIDGAEHVTYRVVPGYAKEGAISTDRARVEGLTFKLPLHAADAGKEAEIVVVSARSIERAEIWLVSDPLPYCRQIWPVDARG
jgi:hypothetical protein